MAFQLMSVLLFSLACFSIAQGANVDCTFGSTFCGYNHDLNAHFQWTLNSGETPSPATGPSSGSYAYIETSWPRLNTEAARLISPAVTPQDGNCLAFSYYMYGLNIRRLNVYSQESSGARSRLWSVGGEQSNAWKAATVPLPDNRNKDINVVFEGLVGTGYMGDIAINNVTLKSISNCVISPTVATPTTPTPTPPPVPPTVPKCGVRPPVSRIVGGTDAKHGDWPWQAMLMWEDESEWKQFCGGTLVAEKWVVTASHCISDIRPEEYTSHKIRLGAHKRTSLVGTEQDFDIKKIYMHEDYNKYPAGLDYDVALIRLSKPAVFTTYVHPACLPDGSIQFPAGSDCWITGWGTIQSDGASAETLQQAKTKLTSYADCTKNGSYPAVEITERMLCASETGIDTCQGDSGGPLVCEANGKLNLVGVTSWGYGCALPTYPGIYARVTKLKEWIFHHISNPR